MRTIVLTIALLLVASSSWAWGNRGKCTQWDSATSVNSGHYHCHNDKDTVNKLESQVGVGHDLQIWESKKDKPVIKEAVIEYRYDMNNERHSAFLVGKSKLSDLWDNLKSLFNKEE